MGHLFRSMKTWLPAASLAAIALTGCDNTFGEPDLNNEAALRSFQTCDDLDDYIEQAILESLVRNSGGWGWAVDDFAEAGGDVANDGGRDAPTDFTTTNNQEEGVDELDIVKTNGTHIFSVEQDTLYITQSWPIEDTELASSVQLGGYARGLFLQGDTAIVLSQRYNNDRGDDNGLTERSWSSTLITVIDVSDPSAPEVLREVDIEGYLANGRLINGKVTLAVNSYMPIPQVFWDLLWDDEIELPEYDWEDTEAERELKRQQTREILSPYVAELASEMDLTEFLPLYRDQLTDSPEAPVESLHACTDIYRPSNLSQYSVLSIVEIDATDTTDPVETAGLLSDGWQIYASQDNFYVAQTSWWWWWGWGDLDLNTHIHQFALTDTGPRYAASGSVPGWLLDQFSFSEYDGHLRVATTDNDWWWGTQTEDAEEAANNIFVLENQDGALTRVGEVRGIAPGERIFASRMMGEKGYLVTFRQTDPLFTIDLSDPTDPRVIGELHIPGYSAYLHPMGDDHLLAVGMDGTDDGTLTGLAVNVFDVSDFTNPQLAHQWTLPSDGWSWSEALSDHHAFTYHRGVLSFPAYNYDYDNGSYFSGLIVLDASADGITELGRVDHQDLVDRSECYYDWECEDGYDYYRTAWMRRSVYIEDNLFSLSNYGIKVNDLNAPDTELAEVLYQPE